VLLLEWPPPLDLGAEEPPEPDARGE